MQLFKITFSVSCLVNLEKSVAFHAWSNHNPIHAAAGAILVLDHVATNVGNAYDSLTGVFTAPLSGLYDFQGSHHHDFLLVLLHASVKSSINHHLHLSLRKLQNICCYASRMATKRMCILVSDKLKGFEWMQQRNHMLAGFISVYVVPKLKKSRWS